MIGRGYNLTCKICERSLEIQIDKFCPNINCEKPLYPINDKDNNIFVLLCKVCGYKEDVFEFVVESKPSKYRKWNCDQCGYVSRDKPDKRKRIGEYWYYQCPNITCRGIVYCIGRKFYHAHCYDGAHI